jgi:RimJ/RimL family protein N-acetyltransferase
VTSEAGPLLVTERLELWLPTKHDIAPMLAVTDDPMTRRHLPSQTPADHFQRFFRNAGSWLLYGYGAFMLRERGGSGELIGNVGVFHTLRGLGEDFDDQPEAGWVLRADRTGRGLARQAHEAVLAWFDREHGPRRIVCMIAPGNPPSLALAERLGFRAMREAELPDGTAVRLFERLPG